MERSKNGLLKPPHLDRSKRPASISVEGSGSDFDHSTVTVPLSLRERAMKSYKKFKKQTARPKVQSMPDDGIWPTVPFPDEVEATSMNHLISLVPENPTPSQLQFLRTSLPLCPDSSQVSSHDLLTAAKNWCEAHGNEYPESTKHHFMEKKWAVSAKIGHRNSMEDTWCAVTGLNALCGMPDEPRRSLFCVFDGHAGGQCSQYARQHFPFVLAKGLSLVSDVSEDNIVTEALQRSFHSLDRHFTRHAVSEDNESGTTAISVFVEDSDAYVSHVGDSCAIVVDKKGDIIYETVPHSPGSVRERERIRKAGGAVVPFSERGRVDGVLAVTRAIGDVRFSKYVIPQCDTIRIAGGKDEFSVLIASDGLWNVYSGQEVAEEMSNVCRGKATLQEVVDSLVDGALARGTTDNVAVMMVVVGTK